MRWDALFADMELQLASAEAQDRADDVAGLTRAERAAVLLEDRLRASGGRRVRLTMRSGGRVEGAVAEVGPGWALVSGLREHLVALASVVVVTQLQDDVAPPPGSVVSLLRLGHALRAVARDRALVRIETLAGTLVGRIDAVGADHLDVAVAYPDDGRPTGERQVVTFAGLDLVTSV